MSNCTNVIFYNLLKFIAFALAASIICMNPQIMGRNQPPLTLAEISLQYGNSCNHLFTLQLRPVPNLISNFSPSTFSRHHKSVPFPFPIPGVWNESHIMFRSQVKHLLWCVLTLHNNSLKIPPCSVSMFHISLRMQTFVVIHCNIMVNFHNCLECTHYCKSIRITQILWGDLLPCTYAFVY